jgi:hypothetical protein
MTKHSRFERGRRASEGERVREVTAAWLASLPADVAKSFAADVAAARSREPAPPPAPMAPGTPPRPPRPGHEPKVKEERPQRRRSG